MIDLGVKYIAFIQDTTAHFVNAILPCLGVSVVNEFGFNFSAVPRVPQEAIGAITKLAGKKKSITVNIEYNQLQEKYIALKKNYPKLLIRYKFIDEFMYIYYYRKCIFLLKV